MKRPNLHQDVLESLTKVNEEDVQAYRKKMKKKLQVRSYRFTMSLRRKENMKQKEKLKNLYTLAREPRKNFKKKQLKQPAKPGTFVGDAFSDVPLGSLIQ